MQDLYNFFGWWQLTVGIFAFVALISIWQHITKDQEKGKKDLGLAWLSLAVLVWAISGIVEIFYAQSFTSTGLPNPETDDFYKGIRSIISMANSALILLALPCFKHSPVIISKYIKSAAWRLLVITIFVFGVLVNLLMLTELIAPKNPALIYSLDVAYAVFTLIFLGLTLWASFEKRGLKNLAYLSAICIICTLIAQISKLNFSDFLQIFFSCTFKTILIMLFFALALSWAEELSKPFMPKSSDIHLVFLKKKNNLKKFEYSIILTIPPIIQTQKITFTEKPFELFLKFAQKRKQEDENQNGWLEIQPKSDKAGNYDLKDYNQINRILDHILNQINGQDNWTADGDRKPLKNALFDYQNRKIRLRVDPKNITLLENSHSD